MKIYKYLKRRVDWLGPEGPNKLVYEFGIPSILGDEEQLKELAKKCELNVIERTTEGIGRPTQRFLIAENAFTNFSDCDNYISKVTRTLQSIAIFPSIYCSLNISEFPFSNTNLLVGNLADGIGFHIKYEDPSNRSIGEILSLLSLDHYISGSNGKGYLINDSKNGHELRISIPVIFLDNYFRSGRVESDLEFVTKDIFSMREIKKQIDLVDMPAAP